MRRAVLTLELVLLAACSSALATCTVAAQVIEPNGAQVPLTPPGSTEQSVQDYFAARTPPAPFVAIPATAAA